MNPHPGAPEWVMAWHRAAEEAGIVGPCCEPGAFRLWRPWERLTEYISDEEWVQKVEIRR